MGTKLMIQDTLNAMIECIVGLENKIITLKRTNNEKDKQIQELHAQINPDTETKNPTSLLGTLKALFEHKEKVWILAPHDWDSNKRSLDTFIREAKIYLENHSLTKPGNTEKVVNVIAGYMTGTTVQWYTTTAKVKAQNNEFWYEWELFWRDVKLRFRDADPSFTARNKLEKLKQGSKSVHYFNVAFNEHARLTGYNKVALVNTYYGGLNNDTLWGIFSQEIIPNTIDEAQKVAILIKNLKEQLDQFTTSHYWESAKTLPKTTLMCVLWGTKWTKLQMARPQKMVLVRNVG